jgi:hypothetical protein
MTPKRRAADTTHADWYKTAATLLLGIVLSSGAHWIFGPKNVLTQEDLVKLMPAMIAQYSPYTGDAKNLSTQLQALHDEQVRQGAQIGQMSVDVGRISEKIGVTAHPAGEQR